MLSPAAARDGLYQGALGWKASTGSMRRRPSQSRGECRLTWQIWMTLNSHSLTAFTLEDLSTLRYKCPTLSPALCPHSGQMRRVTRFALVALGRQPLDLSQDLSMAMSAAADNVAAAHTCHR